MATHDEKFPLHAAAFDANEPDGVNLAKLREALDQGADPNMANEHGRSALSLTHSVEAAQMLIDAGAGFDHEFYISEEWKDRGPEFAKVVGDHLQQLEAPYLAWKAELEEVENMYYDERIDDDAYRIREAELADDVHIAEFERVDEQRQALEVEAHERAIAEGDHQQQMEAAYLAERAEQAELDEVENMYYDERIDDDAYRIREAELADEMHIADFERAHEQQQAQQLEQEAPDVNERNDLGQTPLMQHLAQLGTWEATHTGQQVDHAHVEDLLKAGADPTIDDDLGNTPLHAKGIDLHTIEMLQAHGADINARNALGETPLHIQAQHLDVQDLVALGAAPSINAQDLKGRTPLMSYLEAQSGQDTVSPEYVGRFLEAGADPLAVDRSGKSVMEYTGQNVEAGDVVQKHIEAQQEPVLLAHERLFNDFKERVRGPAQQHEPTPLEQAQQARAPSLGAGAKPVMPRQQDDREQSAPAPGKMPHLENRHEASVEHLKGVKLMDLKIPQRGGQEQAQSADHDFNVDMTRRVAAKMAPSLGQAAVDKGLAPAPAPAQDQEAGKEQGQGKNEGGHSRPSDESYYQAVSSGSIATPERDVQSAEKQAARRRVDRSRSLGL